MIQEINSKQFVAHYFEKAYNELDKSPEAFLRAALEFVQREDGLLSQPNAIEALNRLARLVQDQQESSKMTDIDTRTIEQRKQGAAIDSSPESGVEVASRERPQDTKDNAAASGPDDKRPEGSSHSKKVEVPETAGAFSEKGLSDTPGGEEAASSQSDTLGKTLGLRHLASLSLAVYSTCIFLH